MKSAALVLFVLCAVPAQAQERQDRALDWSIGALTIAATADATTSMALLSQPGFREGNPLLKPFQDSPVAFGIAKGAYTAGLIYAIRGLHKTHPRAAVIVAIVATAIEAGLVASNARLQNGGR
jgi:hypothetical protein